MNLAKMNRILEIFWWSMAVVTLVLVIVMSIVDAADKWAYYYAVPGICVVLALVRHFMWKKLKNSEAFRDGKK